MADLNRKMVFLGGPRQVGKTALAKDILSSMGGRYFNWDFEPDKKNILGLKWSDKDNLLVFDELHKYPRWKNWIKGCYDVQNNLHKFLVTGSARLDIYRKGGDSLLGRYHYWRLHPFSLDEKPKKMSLKETFDRLMLVGGFPEPFLDGSEKFARRWQIELLERVLREDVQDLEPVRQLQNLSLLVGLLRSRVGGPIVVSNLAQDLQVSSNTVKHWLDILERMYFIFRVYPYSQNLVRGLQKPAKVYFYDNGQVEDQKGARLENLVATHLLKAIHYQEDSQGYRFQLCYVRDKEGREVDFAVIRGGKLEQLIEVKTSDDSLSKNLVYFSERLKPAVAFQFVLNIKNEYSVGKLQVVDLVNALANWKC